MPKKISFKVPAAKDCVRVVEVDTVAQALQVYFQRGAKIARTVVQNQWPPVSVDLDKQGISMATLHNWEQGRRQPTGDARVLLRVAAKHPKVVSEAVA